MKCQFCGRKATTVVTKIVQKQKQELPLCDGCAAEHGLFPAAPGPQLDLQALVNLLTDPAAAPGPSGPAAADPAALTCPACGLKYAVFRADGRLGCPHDYDVFRPALEPLLERIHRSARHAGKVPGRLRRAAALADLRERLAAAVAAENYEEAARLRDRLRQKETADEPR